MECVACDSFRMAYYKFDYQGDSVRFIIDPKAIALAVEILQILKAKSIDFYLNQTQCILNVNDINIRFGLYKDTYPNIINIILSEQKQHFKVNLNELLTALNRGSLFVSNEQRPVVNFKIENNKLTIKFLSNEIGNEFIEIDLLDSNTDKFEVRLNQKYLLSILSTIKSETISFNYTPGGKGIIITSENPYFLNLITRLTD
ncbi:MAG: hypothetical protein MJ223_00915 [Mycoplasmoidaceae bacterium]|nr:hypothetical protein [Mycoplasmoidaceae bacterium]